MTASGLFDKLSAIAKGRPFILSFDAKPTSPISMLVTVTCKVSYGQDDADLVRETETEIVKKLRGNLTRVYYVVEDKILKMEFDARTDEAINSFVIERNNND